MWARFCGDGGIGALRGMKLLCSCCIVFSDIVAQKKKPPGWHRDGF
jgi:hypothetical protein